eukprot:jgi/Bigna1/144650/aug1.89_g19358
MPCLWEGRGQLDSSVFFISSSVARSVGLLDDSRQPKSEETMRAAILFLLSLSVISSMGTKTEWGVESIDTYIREIRATMDIAKYATLATFSRTSQDINSRIIFPKPTNITKAEELERVYFATNKHSRKYKELQPSSSSKDHPARVNLLYWDPEGHNRTDWRPLTLIRSDPTAKWSVLPDQKE